MDPNRWERIKEVFATAVETDPADRAGFLDQASPIDSDIRPEIERLLAQYDAEGDLLGDGDVLGWLTCEGAEPPPGLGQEMGGSWDLEARAAEPTFQEGDIVAGRFRVARYIGRGGMGEVYEVEDLDLGGRIALKTLRPEFLGDAGHVSRFKREVQLARKVTHPNVCRIYDVGVDRKGNSDVAFLTMELLEGETLSAFLRRRGRLPAEEALPIARQVCDGLAALHAAQVVHRDLKPGNIILVPRPAGPKAVVTDFGLARNADGQKASPTFASRSTGLFGTPEYMAPEQLTGGVVSAATDIYALGLVLYEMVSGEKLFTGTGLGAAIRRVSGESALPRRPAEGVDERWYAITRRCVSPSAEERPQSPAEVVAALEDSSTARGPRRQLSRHWLVRAGLVAAAIVLVALLGMILRYIGWKGGAGHAQPGQRRVAVLPFRATGGASELQAFADDLTEAVSSRLSQFEGLNQELVVTPASEVRRQQAGDAGDARRKLGVDYAVEGSLHSQGERVRLVLTLIDAANMKQLDSSIVEDRRANALSLQDGAVTQLANLLDLRIQGGHAADWAQSSGAAPGAHEFYLQGRGYVQRSDKLDNIENAITLFRRALDLNDQHAPSYAGLCEAYWYRYERTGEKRWVAEASTNCERALQLNDHLAEAHVTMGRLRNGTGEYAQAVVEFEKALQVEPRNADAFQGLGLAYNRLGRNKEAEATYQKAVALRPSDWTMYKELGLFYNRCGEYRKAIQAYDHVVALTPDNAHGYANLGGFYYRVNDLANAERFWQQALAIDPSRASVLNNLAKLAADLGDHGRALQHWEAIAPQQRTEQVWANVGASYLAAKDLGKSREAYRSAIRLASEQLEINPQMPFELARIAHYWAEIGDHDKAVRLSEEALAADSMDPDVLAWTADTFAAIGQPNRSFELAAQALRQGYSLDAMRRSPNMQVLLKDPVYNSGLTTAEQQSHKPKNSRQTSEQ